MFVVTTHYGNCFYTCQILSVGEITLNYDVSVFAFQKSLSFQRKTSSYLLCIVVVFTVSLAISKMSCNVFQPCFNYYGIRTLFPRLFFA